MTLDAMLMVYMGEDARIRRSMKRTAIESMEAHPGLKEQSMRIFDKVAAFEDLYLEKLMERGSENEDN